MKRVALIALIVVLSAGNRSAAAEALPPVPAIPDEKVGVFRHLEAFQEIAAANGGTRASGTAGYDRTAAYVAEKLEAAGYRVRFEEFTFPYFEDRTPPVLAVEGVPEAEAGNVRTLTNSGSADVTAPLRAVNLELTDTPAASSSGCAAHDFDGFVRGAIALVRRGTCTFQVKAENAVAAGAVGVVIMNEGTAGRTDGFSGLLNKAPGVPVVGISYDRGTALERLLRAGTVSARLAVDAVAGQRSTRNVLTEPDVRGTGPLIVVGAHLDSVPEGPGINDNGSGAAAVLEAALAFAEAFQRAPGDVQFAFWGAEERGLVGSRHHVGTLSEEERRRIGVYINLDMVGSPNPARFIQRSSDADSPLAGSVRQKLLAEFQDRSVPVEERAGGRTGTDDAAFFQKGIPTVGLHTGAGARKSQAQADLFGGAAGKPFDP
ncbi:MAG: M20/M25/M40 family metallo-hydrolase, partial [Xanthobacteraceae bacterium]|nr:M20/M25/M40 family metallo-hydrolase [Xanthobacteraceae bacterium]